MTFFITGTDNTLSMVTWAMLRGGITPEINAIATLTVVVSCLMARGAAVIVRRSRLEKVKK